MAYPGDRQSLPRHGGDLAHATALYGEPRGGWLDLSTGINPIPYPAPPIGPADLGRLPDPDRLARLIATARDAYAVPDGVRLIAAPGSEIAIRLLPLVAPAGKVAILAPTYGSHREAWANAGRAVVAVGSVEANPDDAAILVLANPNNPDGRLTETDPLVHLAEGLGRRGGLLIVDEAFADLAPEASLIPHLAGLPAVVLRSLGKFYGLAGLRLGFVAGAEPDLGRLETLLGDWPVSGPAIAAGEAALADAPWRDATRRRLSRDAARLRALLRAHGLTVLGGSDLFVLVGDRNALALHRRLAERGIWTRAFAEEPTWLRLGLPADDAGFARLDQALAALVALTAAR
jgi:cobalamin biosynthetic protein CobC